jgi:hypothetical protein
LHLDNYTVTQLPWWSGAETFAPGEFEMTVAVDTVRDVASGVTTVRVDGELTFASAPAIRTALSRCTSECATAVIVDLTGLETPTMPET